MNRSLVVVTASLVVAAGTIGFISHGQPSPRSTAPAPVKPKPAKIKLYLFTMANCYPCFRLKKSMKEPAVVKALERFDLEVVEDMEKAREYDVHYFPTLIAVSADGTKTPLEGYQNPTPLAKWLDSIK